jgi:hypothetical protein
MFSIPAAAAAAAAAAFVDIGVTVQSEEGKRRGGRKRRLTAGSSQTAAAEVATSGKRTKGHAGLRLEVPAELDAPAEPIETTLVVELPNTPPAHEVIVGLNQTPDKPGRLDVVADAPDAKSVPTCAPVPERTVIVCGIRFRLDPHEATDGQLIRLHANRMSSVLKEAKNLSAAELDADQSYVPGARIVLPRGGTANLVATAARMRDGKLFSLKIIKLPGEGWEDYRAAADAYIGRREKLMSKLRACDPRMVVQEYALYHGTHLGDDLLVIRQEHCRFAMRSGPSREVSLDDISHALKSAIRAVGELHRNGIVHTDVHERHFVSDNEADDQSDQLVKVCDFERAQVLDENGCAIVSAVPVEFAPETHSATGEHTVTPAADMWAIGLMLHRFVTRAADGDVVFGYDLADSKVMSEKLSSPLFMSMQAMIFASDASAHRSKRSDHAVDLWHRLLNVDPSARITAEQALKHPFFAA